mgnify:CR=1 FL=1
MKRKILALLLVLVTVLGMVPAPAMAASSEEEALGEIDIINLPFLNTSHTSR